MDRRMIFSEKRDPRLVTVCVGAAACRTPIITASRSGRPIVASMCCTSSSRYDPVTTGRATRSNWRVLGRGVRLR